MLEALCNELCIRAQLRLRVFVVWLAAICGLKVVEAEAVILPKGCRAIPLHHYDVDPAVLLQLKDGNRAILYQKMKNWQMSNERRANIGFLKGEQWGTKSDPHHWHKEVFPFLNIRTVKAMIGDLVEAALLVVDGDWCQPLKAEFSGVEQMALNFGKDFQQPGKVFHSSIESKSNSGKAKVSKPTNKRARAGIRKDAVADFPIPEHREQVGEIRESQEADVDGRDILAQLPGELVTGWTDAKLPLEQLVEKYGVERVSTSFSTAKARGYKNPIAGMRTMLAIAPTPSFAPPPSPADDTTEQNWTSEDIEQTAIPAQKVSSDTAGKSWLETHVAPALLANGGVSW